KNTETRWILPSLDRSKSRAFFVDSEEHRRRGKVPAVLRRRPRSSVLLSVGDGRKGRNHLTEKPTRGKISMPSACAINTNSIPLRLRFL
ncbi:unnamed protein product, partial [Musa banksii]